MLDQSTYSNLMRQSQWQQPLKNVIIYQHVMESGYTARSDWLMGGQGRLFGAVSKSECEGESKKKYR